VARSSATPLAILAGSSLCALAIYFGLRAQSPVVAPAPGASAGNAPSASGAARQRPPPARASSGTDTAAIRASAEAALSQLKPELQKVCWQGSERPERARFIFQSTFDADGKEIARGISDVRGFEAPNVGTCLRRQPLDLRFEPPPGRRVRVDVTLDLP